MCLQIKPKKKRRVTIDEDAATPSSGLDWANLATAAGGAIDDPLIDTYLDICFADAPENSGTVLSIDHEVRRFLVAQQHTLHHLVRTFARHLVLHLPLHEHARGWVSMQCGCFVCVHARTL